jgi:ABC-type transport system substrate-binding protein
MTYAAAPFVPSRPEGQRNRRLLVVLGIVAIAGVIAATLAWRPVVTSATRNSVTILGASAATLDPAAQYDSGSSQVIAQLFESLTATDSKGRIQPALASSWEILDGGRRVVFHLRPGLIFSDGSPLRASDVVASWLRVLNPAHPSQLASVLDDVVGARAYREGTGSRSSVGFRASGDSEVEVSLTSPTDFPAIAASPTLSIVPPSLDLNPKLLEAGTFVGSGGYTLKALSETETTLAANPHYWAGPPAIATIHLLSSLGGKSPVEEFQAGRLDYTPVSLIDASWIEYDAELGPYLRIESSPSVEYYGFDTTKAPFSDAHVRRAFAMGIDWRRIVALQANPLEVPATGMVPVGVPGHSDTDFGPRFDLTAARTELAAAGYLNGVGFPEVALVTSGAALDQAIAQQLEDNLGIHIRLEALEWDIYNERLLDDPPAFWHMGWVADYAGANDFLGLLLGTGQVNNFGRWSSPSFEAALDRALAATDPSAMQSGFDEAQAIVMDQAPVIAVDYGAGYALAADGLLGAMPNGLGIVRYAGLAWAAGS